MPGLQVQMNTPRDHHLADGRQERRRLRTSASFERNLRAENTDAPLKLDWLNQSSLRTAKKHISEHTQIMLQPVSVASRYSCAN